MVYQVRNIKVSMIYKDKEYEITGVDSVTIDSSHSQTIVFPKSRAGSGIVQTTGGEAADKLTISSTYLNSLLAKIVQKLWGQNNKERATIIISSLDASDIKYISLEEARPVSKTLQKAIDDNVNSKFQIEFHGKLAEQNYGSE